VSFRIWTEGDAVPVTVRGDARAAVVVAEESPGRPEEIALPTAEVPLALCQILGLGPRPIPAIPPVVLAPGAMAILIGRREPHGHGLEPAVALALARALAERPRHWTVCFAWAAADGAERRRNLEVLEGERAGIWRLHQAEDERVALQPTSSTAVLRELVALTTRAATGA
jgi:hypothetical protein